MLSLTRNAPLKISLIRNFNLNKVIQSWQINSKSPIVMTSCCLHNTSILDHMKGLILKGIIFHKCVRRFVLQSHFDTTFNLCDDLSLKCVGHIFHVSILKGIPDGHDCCGKRAKTVFSLPVLHTLTVLPNIYPC